MKREIKFRGKTTLEKWVFGFLNTECVIRDFSDNRIHYCDKKTIGQYTGIKDKNGKEIYEGDIVYISDIWFEKNILCVCKYEAARARFILEENVLPFGNLHEMFNSSTRYMEIMGNIYDNLELLKQEII